MHMLMPMLMLMLMLMLRSRSSKCVVVQVWSSGWLRPVWSSGCGRLGGSGWLRVAPGGSGWLPGVAPGGGSRRITINHFCKPDALYSTLEHLPLTGWL